MELKIKLIKMKWHAKRGTENYIQNIAFATL